MTHDKTKWTVSRCTHNTSLPVSSTYIRLLWSDGLAWCPVFRTSTSSRKSLSRRVHLFQESSNYILLFFLECLQLRFPLLGWDKEWMLCISYDVLLLLLSSSNKWVRWKRQSSPSQMSIWSEPKWLCIYIAEPKWSDIIWMYQIGHNVNSWLKTRQSKQCQKVLPTHLFHESSNYMEKIHTHTK